MTIRKRYDRLRTLLFLLRLRLRLKRSYWRYDLGKAHCYVMHGMVHNAWLQYVGSNVRRCSICGRHWRGIGGGGGIQ